MLVCYDITFSPGTKLTVVGKVGGLQAGCDGDDSILG